MLSGLELWRQDHGGSGSEPIRETAKVVVTVVGLLVGPKVAVVFQAIEVGVTLNDPGMMVPPWMRMFVPDRYMSDNVRLFSAIGEMA